MKGHGTRPAGRSARSNGRDCPLRYGALSTPFPVYTAQASANDERGLPEPASGGPTFSLTLLKQGGRVRTSPSITEPDRGFHYSDRIQVVFW